MRLADRDALFKAYMPFISSGGLFVPTLRRYKLGDEVFVLLILPEEEERRPLAGRVAWINTASISSRPAGIGVQFIDSPVSEALRNRIEILLAGLPEEKSTSTM